MTDYALARRNMVEGQLRPNRVTDPRLLAVISDLPREKFLPGDRHAIAYADDDVPLGGGRWLMEPMVLARLIQVLQPREGERALVVGSGRGYGSALLGGLVKSVVAVESDATLAAAAEATLKDLGIATVEQVVGPMEAGRTEGGPYDIILVEGAVQVVPEQLLKQLADGGRMAAVLAGPPGAMGVAQLYVKEGGIASARPLFEAGTPPLPGFAPAPRFTF